MLNLLLYLVIFTVSIQSRPLNDDRVVEYYPLTWKILENDFSKNYGQILRTGPARAVKRLGSGDTKGFMSKVFLINFDWQKDGSELGEVPSESAVKVISLGDMKRLFEITGKKNVSISEVTYAAWAHNQELHLYGNITKLGLIDELKFAKFYGGKEFDYKDGWGYLSMEFVENIKVKHIYDEFSDSEIMQGLEQLAKMNAYSLRYQKEFSKLVQSQLFDVWVKDAFSMNALEYLITYVQRYPQKSAEIGKLLQVLATFGDEAKFNEKLAKNCPIKMWIHGDLWPPNVFWKLNEKNESKLKSIVDFQYTALGNPLFDMNQWLFFTVKPHEFHKKRDMYLQHYYTKLREVAQNERIPWDTYEEFLKQFEIMYIWKTVEASHVLETVKNQMLLDLPDEKRIRSEKLFEDRFSVMLDEASRIFDQRKHDLL